MSRGPSLSRDQYLLESCRLCKTEIRSTQLLKKNIVYACQVCSSWKYINLEAQSYIYSIFSHYRAGQNTLFQVALLWMFQ